MKTHLITKIGIATALSVILSYIRLYTFPQGGSISLEMLPILYISFKENVKSGVITGILFGAAKIFTEPFPVHPLQILLDYPLAYGVLGVAGLFRKSVCPGIIIGVFLRGLCHFFSGIIFFTAFTPVGQKAWFYSLLYNGAYLLPTLVLCLVIIPVLLRKIKDE